MEKILVFLFLLMSGLEIMAQKDIDGKIFLFNEESANSYVRMIPLKTGPFKALTVCLKFYTTLARTYSLFSLATTSKDNDFLIFLYPNQPKLSITVGNQNLRFDLTEEKGIEWRSICVSWESSTGLVVPWINGKPYPRKLLQKGYSINASPIIILGQDQDSYGGGFDAKQSFVGEISDVHMWDSVLSNQNIHDILNNKWINGNVINWKSLNYYAYGKVNLAEDICPVYYSPRCLHGSA